MGEVGGDPPSLLGGAKEKERLRDPPWAKLKSVGVGIDPTHGAAPTLELLSSLKYCCTICSILVDIALEAHKNSIFATLLFTYPRYIKTIRIQYIFRRVSSRPSLHSVEDKKIHYG